MHPKIKELRSMHHAAPKTKPILTLFGIEYTAKEFTILSVKAFAGLVVSYSVLLAIWSLYYG